MVIFCTSDKTSLEMDRVDSMSPGFMMVQISNTKMYPLDLNVPVNVIIP